MTKTNGVSDEFEAALNKLMTKMEVAAYARGVTDSAKVAEEMTRDASLVDAELVGESVATAIRLLIPNQEGESNG